MKNFICVTIFAPENIPTLFAAAENVFGKKPELKSLPGSQPSRQPLEIIGSHRERKCEKPTQKHIRGPGMGHG
jgi:hypothetical protein